MVHQALRCKCGPQHCVQHSRGHVLTPDDGEKTVIVLNIDVRKVAEKLPHWRMGLGKQAEYLPGTL